MKKTLIYLCLAAFACAGCIKNDLPYPVVVPNITSMTVQDAVKVDIDYEAQEVTVYVSETTDLRTVVIQSVEFDVDFADASIKLVGTHDLTQPLKFDLTTYQTYEWTIKAERPVERYFTVDGQVGATEIDEYNCRAIAMVSEGTDISDITVTSFKLGPKEVSEYSLQPEQMRDFSEGVSVDVTAFGQTQTWNLYVEVSDVSVEITKVNPWTTEVYVTSLGIAGMDNGFMYREKGTQDWNKVAEADIAADGGSFTAHIKGLRPETAYEVYAYCGTDKTAAREFTTAPATPVPNGSFEYASKVAGKDYYKFYDPDCGVADGSYMFWGSGNGEGSEGVNGSANMGIVITYIDTNDKVDGKQSVRAQTSQMAGILAAGNIFTGQFAGLVGTSGGKVNFGRPWTERPKAVKLYAKYATAPMDIVSKDVPSGFNLIKGETYDRANIEIAFGYWDYRQYGGTKNSPVHVDTTDPSTFVDYKTDKSTIGYGQLIIHHDGYILNGAPLAKSVTDQWVEYTIPINYRDLDTLPTHIIISCAASQYGDYFSGYSNSKLWLDKVELIYE